MILDLEDELQVQLFLFDADIECIEGVKHLLQTKPDQSLDSLVTIVWR